MTLTRKQVENHALTCWNKESERALLAHDATSRQQLAQAQAARTICDVHQAEFDRLEEQLAEATQVAEVTKDRDEWRRSHE